MSSISKFLVQQAAAQRQWAKTLDAMRKLAESKGAKLNLTGHFVERVQTRVARPSEFVGNFEIAVRAAMPKISQADGKRVGVRIKDHVFIIGCHTHPQQVISFITFWIPSTDKKITEIMQGVDIKLEL